MCTPFGSQGVGRRAPPLEARGLADAHPLGSQGSLTGVVWRRVIYTMEFREQRHMQLEVFGTVDEPLFSSNQIAEVLGIASIRLSSIPDHLKVTRTVQTKGGPQPSIYLHEEAVYTIVFRSNSEKAKEVQSCLCNTLRTFRQQALGVQRQELTSCKEELQLLTESKDIRASYLYAIKINPREDDSDCEMKAGMSKSVPKRQDTYRTIVPNSILILSVEVPSTHVREAEGFLKKMLTIACTRLSAEVFRGSLDKVKMWVQVCAGIYNTVVSDDTRLLTDLHYTFDKHINDVSHEEIRPSELAQIRHHLKELADMRVSATGCPPPAFNGVTTTEPQLTPRETSMPPPAPQPQAAPDLAARGRGFDFDRFIQECCIVGQDEEVASVAIAGRHRTWAKHTNKEMQSALNTYLREKFRPARLVHDQKSMNGYVGVNIVEFTRPKSLVPGIPEQFCLDCCSDASASRLYYNDIRDKMKVWLEKRGLPQLDMQFEALHSYLHQYYVKGALWCPEEKVTREGYYGVCLKGDEERFLRKTPSTTANAVNLIDPTTKQVKRKFAKVSEAAAFVGRNPCSISYAIKHQKLLDGCLVEYANKAS